MFLFKTVGKVVGNEIERSRVQTIVDSLTNDLEKRLESYMTNPTLKQKEQHPGEVFDELEVLLRGIYELQAGDDGGDEGCQISVRRRILHRNIAAKKAKFFGQFGISLQEDDEVDSAAIMDFPNTLIECDTLIPDIPDMPAPILLEDQNINALSEHLIFPDYCAMKYETIFTKCRRFIKQETLFVHIKERSSGSSSPSHNRIQERTFHLLR